MPTPKPKAAGANPTVLGEYDGREIIMCSVAIPNASGGLHDALALDPVMFHTGEEITIALKCKVGRISHDPIVDKGEDTGYYNRVATLSALRGTLVPAADVEALFAKQKKRLEEAKGVQAIPGIDE